MRSKKLAVLQLTLAIALVGAPCLAETGYINVIVEDPQHHPSASPKSESKKAPASSPKITARPNSRSPKTSKPMTGSASSLYTRRRAKTWPSFHLGTIASPYRRSPISLRTRSRSLLFSAATVLRSKAVPSSLLSRQRSTKLTRRNRQIHKGLQDRGDYAAAEQLFLRALAIKEKALGPDHPGVAMALNNLGELYYAQGRYDEPEPLLRRGLAIDEAVLGSDHPETKGLRENLTALLRSAGKIEE